MKGISFREKRFEENPKMVLSIEEVARSNVKVRYINEEI